MLLQWNRNLLFVWDGQKKLIQLSSRQSRLCSELYCIHSVPTLSYVFIILKCPADSWIQAKTHAQSTLYQRSIACQLRLGTWKALVLNCLANWELVFSISVVFNKSSHTKNTLVCNKGEERQVVFPNYHTTLKHIFHIKLSILEILKKENFLSFPYLYTIKKWPFLGAIILQTCKCLSYCFGFQ